MGDESRSAAEALLVPRGMAAEPPVAGRSVGDRWAGSILDRPIASDSAFVSVDVFAAKRKP
jgi:hypothetical protein